jgi:hypothetical protein
VVGQEFSFDWNPNLGWGTFPAEQAWANFARAHGKRLSIPEWGVTYRSEGHGGGDNPRFIANMIHFIEDPDQLSRRIR